MLEPTVILQRFGDEEFLRELWLRTRAQIPNELEAIAKLYQNDPRQVSPQLHKLRGLIANFLEGGQAIASLRDCEAACGLNSPRISAERWTDFLKKLDRESVLLETWLADRGYPCS